MKKTIPILLAAAALAFAPLAEAGKHHAKSKPPAKTSKSQKHKG